MPDEEKDGRWIFAPTEYFAVNEGVVYDGHSLSRSKGGNDWFLVIRARRGSFPVVAYVGGRDEWDCFVMAGYLARVKGGLRWTKDKYR
jgi:hypothetical protein